MQYALDLTICLKNSFLKSIKKLKLNKMEATFKVKVIFDADEPGDIDDVATTAIIAQGIKDNFESKYWREDENIAIESCTVQIL